MGWRNRPTTVMGFGGIIAGCWLRVGEVWGGLESLFGVRTLGRGWSWEFELFELLGGTMD